METQSFIPRETKDTLEKETAFKQRIEGYWKVELEKLSSAYSLDFAIVRKGKVASFIELKCRSNMWTKYPTYMISLKKWNMCRAKTTARSRNKLAKRIRLYERVNLRSVCYFKMFWYVHSVPWLLFQA